MNEMLVCEDNAFAPKEIPRGIPEVPPSSPTARPLLNIGESTLFGTIHTASLAITP